MHDAGRPALRVDDEERGDRVLLHRRECFGAERLIELTENPALTNFTLPKIWWVQQHEPRIWSSARTILLPKDYLRFRLTGARAMDVAEASGTLFFDVSQRKWSKPMLEASSIDESLLPALHESPEISGAISTEGAAATGLLAGTPVVAGASGGPDRRTR